MESLAVPSAAFSIEEPWRVPPSCGRASLLLATDGTSPRLATTVAAFRDNDFLNVVFEADDDLVVAEYRKHDEPLWQHDVVEIFLAPRVLTEYFELEVNPLGTTFDARIESPDGTRQTMKTELEWTCEGLFAGILTDRTGSSNDSASTVIRLPFAALGVTPRAGDRWRANFFRIDRHPVRGDEFSAWSPTRKTPADFHVPAAFGELLFV
jgi:hypothetical protein